MSEKHCLDHCSDRKRLTWYAQEQLNLPAPCRLMSTYLQQLASWWIPALIRLTDCIRLIQNAATVSWFWSLLEGTWSQKLHLVWTSQLLVTRVDIPCGLYYLVSYTPTPWSGQGFMIFGSILMRWVKDLHFLSIWGLKLRHSPLHTAVNGCVFCHGGVVIQGWHQCEQLFQQNICSLYRVVSRLNQWTRLR